MRRLPMMLSMIALIMLSTYIVPASAQGTTTPRLLTEITISESRNNKFPSVAVTGQTINVGGGAGTSSSGGDATTAFVWTLAEQATTIGAGFNLGAAAGKPDYSSVALAPAPDGSLYAIWSSINDRTINLRRRDSAGNWGPQRRVASGGFPIFPQVAVASNGQVFGAWQDIDKPLFMAVSSDQGASWPSVFTTSEKVYSTPSAVVAGPSGQIVVGFTTINLNAAVAVWTGSGLSSELLSGAGASADTSVSVGPDGKYYAAWRGLESSGANSGIYYAERQSANSWAKTQITPGEVKGAVNVVVDSGGTIHLGWIANASGALRFFYALRQTGQTQFTTPVATNVSGLFNSRLALSSAGAFAHASLENFSGTTPFITYARFSGGTAGASATPKIEADAAIIKLPTTVAVSFVDVNGDPKQVRWRWGSAPTDAANDSSGWQTYASPLTVTVPSTVTSAATCTPVRLYTQVRTASQATGQAQFDDVVIDADVTAAVSISNPHLTRRSSQFSDLTENLADLSADGGASDGDPTYTREPVVYVQIQGVNECSGIGTLATARSTTRIAPSRKVSKNFFANVLPFPGAFGAGSNAVMVRVSDVAGNSKDYNQTLTYDATAPVLDSSSPGTVAATSDASATILTSLKFTNINVTDNAYPNRGFWGAWIANSRTPVANPSTDTNLVWTPVAAPGTDKDKSFTIANWSLASGLASNQLTAGSYTIYVRFLDGAGNPTSGVITTSLTLSQVTGPKIRLPLVRR